MKIDVSPLSRGHIAGLDRRRALAHIVGHVSPERVPIAPVTVHLMKMAVGIESVDHLRRVQKARLAQAHQKGGPGDLRHLTRNMPKRAEEVLAGGSMFWIVKGYVRVRQRVLGLDRAAGREGRPRCALILDPELIKTELMAQRPIQGWRYLDPAQAPVDLGAKGGNAPVKHGLPPEMAAELRDLGLL